MTYIRNPNYPFMWESDGEFTGRFRATDGSLHDSPEDGDEYEEQRRSNIPAAGCTVDVAKGEAMSEFAQLRAEKDREADELIELALRMMDAYHMSGEIGIADIPTVASVREAAKKEGGA